MDVLSVVEHHEKIGVAGVYVKRVLFLIVFTQYGQRRQRSSVRFATDRRQESMVFAIFVFVTKHLKLYINSYIMKFSNTPQASFFTSWYFIVNFLLVAAYPFMRIFTSVGNRDLRNVDTLGFTYQNSIIYAGLSFVVMYYLRSSSLRQFFINCLNICKIVVSSLLFFAKFRLSLIYVGICLLCWMFISYPKYRGKNKFIRIQSEQQFDDLVGPIVCEPEQKKQEKEEYNPYQYKNKKMFFIEFYADWLAICSISKELWYEYSNRYSTPQFTFLQVNVSNLPQLAKKFKINVSGFTKQLPTVIILEDGEETVRFPPIQQNNKVDRIVKLDYKILLKYFDLESRYLETREKKSKKND